MELRRLRYFAVLAEELNFTRAAARLLIAQPALSQQIMILEREVGAALVERGTRGCSLTPVGVVVAGEAAQLLAHVSAAEERIRSTIRGQRGRLRLAYTRSARGGPTDSLISEFRARNPDVELTVQTGWTAHNLTELLAGRLDLAFVRPPVETPDIRCHVVGTEELLVAVPADHPLARRRRLTREMVADEPVILWPRENAPGMYDRIVSQLWPGGVHVAREEADDEQLLLAVSHGSGIAPVPEGRARALRVPGVRLRHLTAPVPTVDLAVAYPVRAVAPAVQLFLQQLLPPSAVTSRRAPAP